MRPWHRWFMRKKRHYRRRWETGNKNNVVYPYPKERTVHRAYTWHVDGGHAWLAVRRDDLAQLPLAAPITSYSYRTHEWAYLEEDFDAWTFLTAADQAGWAVTINQTVRYVGSCFIPGLSRFSQETQP